MSRRSSGFFCYLNQVTGDSTKTYTYDANGNRTSGTTTGAWNEITSDGTWTYTYDAAGELTQKSQGPSATTWNYSYNNREQMVSAIESTAPGGTVQETITYQYDVFGDLIGDSPSGVNENNI